jgi:membrane protease YdiL (CAAX protease family)
MESIAGSQGLKLKWIALAWLGLLFTTLAIATIGGIVRGDPARLVMSWGFSDFAIFAIGVYVVGVGLAVFILWRLLRRQGLDATTIGLRGGLSAPGVGLAFVAVLVGSALYLAAEAGLGFLGIGMYWVPKTTHLVLRNGLDVGVTLLFAVVLGPIFEEIFFRGYLVTLFLGRGRGILGAATLSGLVFASTHAFLGPGIMVFIFVWSFLPALLYWRTKSLYPAILFHVINNFLAYIVVPGVFS